MMFGGGIAGQHVRVCERFSGALMDGAGAERDSKSNMFDGGAL